VTTPYGYKPRASGMTLVCRPTPCVRFHPHRRALLTDLWIGWHTEQFGSLVLLPEGASLGTRKHYWVVSVLENRCIIAQTFKRCKSVFRLRAARLISPCLKPGALRRDLVMSCPCTIGLLSSNSAKQTITVIHAYNALRARRDKRITKSHFHQ
jgi:hypothetical protein